MDPRIDLTGTYGFDVPLEYRHRLTEFPEGVIQAVEPFFAVERREETTTWTTHGKLVEHKAVRLHRPAGTPFFLTIVGPIGTGKSSLAGATVTEWRQRGLPSNGGTGIGEWLSLNKMADAMRDWSDSGKYRLRQWTEGQFLVIDELGGLRNNPNCLEKIICIVDHRYCNRLITMFTSNATIEEMSAGMGERLASRLQSGLYIKLEGNDRRRSDG
jgi:DNA replication protein DnaC